MAAHARKRLIRDFRKLQTDPPHGVSGAPITNDIMKWQAVIFGPDETPWEGGTFQLEMTFNSDYPNKPPSVRFLSKLFHPNVYADGKICLDILQSQWSPIYDISAILTSIQSLLTDPNPNSPANQEAARLYAENRREYNRRVEQCVSDSWATVDEKLSSSSSSSSSPAPSSSSSGMSASSAPSSSTTSLNPVPTSAASSSPGHPTVAASPPTETTVAPPLETVINPAPSAAAPIISADGRATAAMTVSAATPAAAVGAAIAAPLTFTAATPESVPSSASTCSSPSTNTSASRSSPQPTSAPSMAGTTSSLSPSPTAASPPRNPSPAVLRCRDATAPAPPSLTAQAAPSNGAVDGEGVTVVASGVPQSDSGTSTPPAASLGTIVGGGAGSGGSSAPAETPAATAAAASS